MNFDIYRYIHHGVLSIPGDERLNIPERITIPEGVHTVSNAPINFTRKVKRVFFPESVKTINAVSFSVWDLTKIDIPYVQTLGNFAFSLTPKLRYVNISGLRGEIPKGAFHLSVVEEVIIPSGIIKINDFAFSLNPDLRKVVLPKSLKYIGERAFHRCAILNDFTIPPNVEYIGPEAFKGSAYRCSYIRVPRQARIFPNSFNSGIDIIRY